MMVVVEVVGKSLDLEGIKIPELVQHWRFSLFCFIWVLLIFLT